MEATLLRFVRSPFGTNAGTAALTLSLALAAAPAAQAQGGIVLIGDSTSAFSLVASEPHVHPDMSMADGNATFYQRLVSAGDQIGFFAWVTNGAVHTELRQFYGDLLGHTTRDVIAANATGLSGLDVFISAVPYRDFSVEEQHALLDFVNGGGTLMLLGDFEDGINYTHAAGNRRINQLLNFMGSPLQLARDMHDPGPQRGTGAQIGSTSFTAGITAFDYGAAGGVIGGTPQFFTSDGTPFVTLTLAAPVPEPQTWALWMAGMVGLGAVARRRRG